MEITLVESRDSLRKLYWRLAREKFNFRGILSAQINWDADTFEEMFHGYWTIYKITKGKYLLGIFAIVNYEGTVPEACSWRSRHGTPRQAYKAGLTLIPKAIASCKTLKAYTTNPNILRLAWMLGAEIDEEKGEMLWAEAADQPPNHQNQHQHQHQ